MKELALAAFAAERGIHPRTEARTARFAAFAKTFDARAYLEALERRGLRWLGRSDRRFPPLLRAISDSPSGLFLRGEAPPELLAKPAVAIVGARACSGYGAQVARMLGRELAAAGLVVVSGLARGVDGEAHRGALEGGGATVAVLGCGVDRDYPAAHAELAAPDRRHRASSSPSTHPASSRHRGVSPPGTESSPGSRRPRLWSRLASEAAR